MDLLVHDADVLLLVECAECGAIYLSSTRGNWCQECASPEIDTKEVCVYNKYRCPMCRFEWVAAEANEAQDDTVFCPHCGEYFGPRTLEEPHRFAEAY